MKPLFSVIIPVYNKGPHIARAIKSVLKQSFDDFELILVCDPSTDNSNSEIEKFSDSRLAVYYRNKPGPGGYAARNLGVEKSSGTWIAFLDADDLWSKQHLENLKTLSIKYPESQVLTCARILEEEGQRKLDTFSKSVSFSDGEFSFSFYLEMCVKNRRPISTNSVAIRKSLLPDSNWFPDGRAMRSGDLYFWVKALSHSRKFAWTSHVGCISFRDIVGVSKSSVPSISLNQEMVNEVGCDLDENEFLFLKKYANRLIRIAWFEKKRKSFVKNRLSRELYWSGDWRFCFFWSSMSLLPLSYLNLLKKIFFK